MEQLLKVQQELHVPKAQKNSFGNYMYRSCEDIVEAAKPLCHEEGLMLTLSDEVIEVGGRVYVKATAKVTLPRHEESRIKPGDEGNRYKIEVPDQSVESYGWAREAETKKGMDDAQITGSASSYARKYALNGLFAIDDTKDDDSTNTHGKDSQKPEMGLSDAFTKLSTAKSSDELTKLWRSLPASLQGDAEILAKCTELKAKLS